MIVKTSLRLMFPCFLALACHGAWVAQSLADEQLSLSAREPPFAKAAKRNPVQFASLDWDAMDILPVGYWRGARGTRLCGLSSVLPKETVASKQRRFNIVRYGAVASGEDLGVIERNTKAIQKAIDACADAGGGCVVVPPGTFLSGTIFLRSNVTLHLEEGAVLLGSPTIKHYPPARAAKKRRYENYLHMSLIFAQGVDRVSVTGKGTLNGNSQAKNDFMAGGRRGRYHRPTLIWFDECTNVSIQGVTFTSSGFWTSAYTMCRNVHIDGIEITDSSFPNNDGCDICDCENVIIENCDIDALDDAICLKGYMPGGCKNVVIRNNRLRSLCNGIKAGTDSSGGFQNLLIENNVIHDTGIAGIALEIVDGGTMRNVLVRNITMDVVGTPIFIKLGNRNRPLFDGDKKFEVTNGTLSDVHISNIRATVDKAKKVNAAEKRRHNYACYASSITGFPGHFVERLTIEDVDVTILGGFPIREQKDAQREMPERSNRYPENRMFGTLPAHAFYIRHAKDLRMKNVRVEIKQQDARPAFVLDDVHDSTFEGMHTESISATSPVLVKPNCSNVNWSRQRK